MSEVLMGYFLPPWMMHRMLRMVMMKMCNKEWALFFSWTALQLLWSNMDKAAISAISKIVGPQEIGKILCLVNKSS